MRKQTWNPYFAVALAGVLLVLSVLVAGHFLGASTTFARSASVIEKAVGVDTSQFEYFTTKNGKYGPGSLFGIGWGLLGYCPGTAGGALGEGRIDGLWGILGMLCGDGLYAVIYPFTQVHITSLGSYGKISLPQAIDISHWSVIIVFGILTILLFRFFEKKSI